MTQHECCGANGTGQCATYRPSVDIVETPNDVVLFADVPGVDESHVDVTLDKNVLTIRDGRQTDLRRPHGGPQRIRRGRFRESLRPLGRRQSRGHRGHRERRRPAVAVAQDGAVGPAEDQRRRSLVLRALR